MSKLNAAQSSTNNQSTERSRSKAPFLLANDNLKFRTIDLGNGDYSVIKQDAIFLCGGIYHTLEELTIIFALTNLKG